MIDRILTFIIGTGLVIWAWEIIKKIVEDMQNAS